MSTPLSDIFAGLSRRHPPVGPDERLLEISLAGQLLLPVAVFAVAASTIAISHSAKFVSTLWLANGVVLVALLRHARTPRNYGLILAGAAGAIWLANLVNGGGAALSAAMTLANLVEVATALVLLRIFNIDAANLTQFRNLLIFIVVAGIAPITSATIGGIATELARGIPWLVIWRNWYFSDGLGMIIVVPFLISVTSKEGHALRIRERPGEAIAVLVLVVAVGICAAYFRSVIFIIVPAILFATLRFGLIGATAATLVTALITSGFVLMGIGQPLFSRPELSDRILALQVLLAFTSLWSLPTAALLNERNRLLDDLSRANAKLMADSESISRLVTGLRRHLSIVEEK
jgi:integral membrane sensor domain MASE1